MPNLAGSWGLVHRKASRVDPSIPTDMAAILNTSKMAAIRLRGNATVEPIAVECCVIPHLVGFCV